MFCVGLFCVAWFGLFCVALACFVLLFGLLCVVVLFVLFWLVMLFRCLFARLA